MKHFASFLFIFLFIGFGVKAQQEVQFTQNMFNHMAINPGFAGLNKQICAKMLARQQWLGFKDGDDKVSPQTYLFSINSNINPIRGGLGLTIYSDKLGYFDNTGVKLAYSYHYYSPFGFPGVLGIGVEGGFANLKIDYAKFKPNQTGDPLLNGGEETTMAFDIAFGLYYRIPNQMYIAISSTQMLQTQSSLPGTLVPPKLKRHYFVTAGYDYALPNNPSIVLQPSVFVKSDITAIQYDINCLAVYNNRFWGGLSYRSVDAVAFIFGANPFTSGKFETLKLGYAYDFTTSALGRNGRSSGSHELMVGYCFEIKIEKLPTGYSNTRFL